MTSWHCRLRVGGTNLDFLDNAIMIFTLGGSEKPAVRPRQTEASSQHEIVARHPALVGIRYRQFLDVAWKMVIHGEVDLLISAAVGALEELERLVINTLRLFIRKLNCLSTMWNNSNHQAEFQPNTQKAEERQKKTRL